MSILCQALQVQFLMSPSLARLPVWLGQPFFAKNKCSSEGLILINFANSNESVCQLLFLEPAFQWKKFKVSLSLILFRTQVVSKVVGWCWVPNSANQDQSLERSVNEFLLRALAHWWAGTACTGPDQHPGIVILNCYLLWQCIDCSIHPSLVLRPR